LCIYISQKFKRVSVCRFSSKTAFLTGSAEHHRSFTGCVSAVYCIIFHYQKRKDTFSF